MKKVMRFLAACSMAMFVMACSEDPTDPTDPNTPDDPNNGDNTEEPTPEPDNSPVELLSVVFYAADNGAYLSDDVAVESVVEEKEGDMVVRVKDGGAGKELKMTLTAGANNMVKVDGVEQTCSTNEDGTVECKASFDATFPADITVSNEAGESKKYVVKVGKVLETVVEQAASYTEPDCTISDAIMAVNPKDNMPYVCYIRKSTASGAVNQLSVVRWNGVAFESVGSLGFTSPDKAASAPYLAFDKDGVPYVSYIDASADTAVTVKRLGAGNWETVGTEGFSSKANTSYSTALVFNPATNMPVVFYTNNVSKTDANYREMMKSEWNGSSWVDGPANLTPRVEGTTGVYMGSQSVQVGDAVYVASTCLSLGYYVHKFQNSTWTTVVDGPNAGFYNGAKIHAGYINIFADAAGNTYVVGGTDEVAAGSWDIQIWKLDEANKTMVPYGNIAPVGFGSSRENMAASVNPVSGEVFGMYRDQTSALAMFSSINEDLQWNQFDALNTKEADTKMMCLDFAADGTGYATFLVKQVTEKNEAGETVVTVPASIELFRIGLEADVLPE